MIWNTVFLPTSSTWFNGWLISATEQPCSTSVNVTQNIVWLRISIPQFFPKTSALPTRLPRNKNILYSHVTLMGMLHSCSMSWLLLYHDALFLWREWNLFWMTCSTWGRDMPFSSLAFWTPCFGGWILCGLEGHLPEAS